MFFLQHYDLPEEALGRITLGPLECVETSLFIISKTRIKCNIIDSFRYTKICGDVYD